MVETDGWLRRTLGCPESFATLPTTQLLFAAAMSVAKEGERQSEARSVRADAIEPGLSFWRLLLLLSCYVQIYIAFEPSHQWVAHTQLSSLAQFLTAHLGAPPLSEQQAHLEGAAYGPYLRFDQLCEWGIARMLSTTPRNSLHFRELERRLISLTSRASATPVAVRQRPVAVPLALM